MASTIAIETLGGVATPLVPRCRPLPTEIVETFSTAETNQSQVEIHLVLGEAGQARDNRSLGRFYIRGIRPAPAGVPVIMVSIAVGRDGVVSVSAHDRDTGTQQAVTIVLSPEHSADAP